MCEKIRTWLNPIIYSIHLGTPSVRTILERVKKEWRKLENLQFGLHILPTILNGTFVNCQETGILFPNRLKTSNVEYDRSVGAKFSAPKQGPKIRTVHNVDWLIFHYFLQLIFRMTPLTSASKSNDKLVNQKSCNTVFILDAL